MENKAASPLSNSIDPYIWALAIALFLVSEVCSLWIGAHYLLNASPARRWSMPIAFLNPLIVGYHFSGGFRNGRRSGTAEVAEAAAIARTGLAILVVVTYALLIGTTLIFF